MKFLVSALELREPKGCMDMGSVIFDNIFVTLLFYPFSSLKTALELQKAEFYGAFRA